MNKKPGRKGLIYLLTALGIICLFIVLYTVFFSNNTSMNSGGNKADSSLPVSTVHESRYTDHSQAPYQEPSEEGITSFESMISDLNDKIAGLVDSSGYVSEDNQNKLLRTAGTYLQDQYQKGTLSEYAIDENSVFFRDARTGLSYNLVVPLEGKDAVGVNAEISIRTFQPFRANYIQYRDALTGYMMSLPDNAAIEVDETFDNYTFSHTNNMDNEEVPYDVFTKFGPNQLIIWHGHGDYTEALGSYILTSTVSSIQFKLEHWEDYTRNRLTNCGYFGRSIEHYNICVTSEYIKTYCGNMQGSVIYMGICESGRTRQLADAFLDKGADAFIGNSQTIITKYNLRMQNTIISRLTQINPDTGDYYTLEEARSYACGMYGTDDGKGATPLIFGDGNYRLRSAAEERMLGPDADQRMTIADTRVYYGTWQETYLTILRNHANSIRTHQEQIAQIMPYLNGDPLYVALPDMNGDRIPELIFIQCPNDRETDLFGNSELEGDLYLYRSNGTETRCVATIRDTYLDVNNGAEYTVAFCPTNQTFHTEYYVGDGRWQRSLSIAHYQEETYMRLSWSDPDDAEDEYANNENRYFLNGRYISKEHFDKVWLTLSESPYKVIGSLDYKSDIPDALYTLDEAMHYLENK